MTDPAEATVRCIEAAGGDRVAALEGLAGEIRACERSGRDTGALEEEFRHARQVFVHEAYRDVTIRERIRMCDELHRLVVCGDKVRDILPESPARPAARPAPGDGSPPEPGFYQAKRLAANVIPARRLRYTDSYIRH